MPDTVIARVERYGKENALPGIFDFADRNGVLFEWNEAVNECPEGILDNEDVILYPSIAAELPGVDLKHDTPRPLIEADLIPHCQAEDEATRNANHKPFGVVGVEPAAVIHAEEGKIDSKEDNDNGIIAINDVPPPMEQDPLILSDLSDDKPHDNNHNSDKDSNDNSDNGGNDEDPFLANAVAKQVNSGDDEDEEQENQGVRQLRHKNKGTNRQYDDYTLMMHGRRKARGGQRRATIHDGVCFFSA